MVAGYGWWWYRRRFGLAFDRLVREFEAREGWTLEQFRRYQEQSLDALFAAARKSDYYRKVFTDAGLTPDTPPFSALERLPFLSKETLRTRAKDLLTGSPPRGTIVFKSSGTTGTPTE